MDPTAQRKIFSVYELTAEIKRSLDRFGILWIQGEISNFKRHSSGHLYFSLKDGRAQIRAACFRNHNMYLKFRPEDGMEVIVRGRLGVYEPRGDYQFIAEYMEPVGQGSLQLAYERLKEKLLLEGVFDQARKRPLPLLPRKVGIVTSPTGAAIRDMLRVLKRRNASLDVLIYPARVQGAGAAGEIAEGIRCLDGRSDIDVLIVGRGGGSIEDLWAFNEEALARVIHGCRLPLISAVGHETDFTIADFAADVRASTPSAAAELVSAAREELLGRVTGLHGRLDQAMRRGMDTRRLLVERLARSRAFTVAPGRIRDLQQRFDEGSLRLCQAMRRHGSALRQRERVLSARLGSVDLSRFIRHERETLAQGQRRLAAAVAGVLRTGRSRFEIAAGRIHALSPLAILGRGFALCRDGDGNIVSDASAVAAGDPVRVTLARGELDCRVEAVSR